MQIAESREALDRITQKWSSDKLDWAFVPTMGALHEGHLTLVREALKHFPRVVVSVFVNPTQFDRADDLERYPRQPEKDAEMLRGAGAHAMFLPSVKEVYPEGTDKDRVPDLDGLDTRYEGSSRPGHFDGVVQVVRRLSQAVNPKGLFLGQKDAQQVAVLQRAAAQEFWPLKIYAVPIVREKSGLAMSSRNALLSKEAKVTAATINKVLAKAEADWNVGNSPRSIEKEAADTLIAAGFKPEYFDFINADTFEQIPDLPKATQPIEKPLIVMVAWLDGVRLLDNRMLF
ncbi:MAG: pantoate--beta-alanine ligase [Saprospiraceae bacterium]